MEATPTTPTEAIDEELRRAELAREAAADEAPRAPKRRREDEPEEEEMEVEGAEELTAMPPEVLLGLVERFEAAQRGVSPAQVERLSEASQLWREFYVAWVHGRVAKMERRPPATPTLALARLFVSARWKLVSGMSWEARRDVVRAYIPTLMERSWGPAPMPSVLVIARQSADPAIGGQWIIGFANTQLSPPFVEPITVRVDFFTDEIHYKMHGIEFSPEGVAGTGRFRARPVNYSEFLIYGRAKSLIDRDMYDVHATVDKVMIQMRNVFFASAGARWQLQRPTRGMLAWKDKLVVVSARDITLHGPSNITASATIFRPDGSAESRALKSIPMEGTLESFVETSRRLLISGSLHPKMRYTIGAGWLPADVTLYDSATGYLIDKDLPVIEAIASIADRQVETKLKPLAEFPEWGYRMTKYMPHTPRIGGSTGLLIMPAPWFFYASVGAAGQTIRFQRAILSYRLRQIHLLQLDSSTVLAHQPFEMLYIPDDLPGDELEGLAMLQRRDITERATAKVAGGATLM